MPIHAQAERCHREAWDTGLGRRLQWLTGEACGAPEAVVSTPVPLGGETRPPRGDGAVQGHRVACMGAGVPADLLHCWGDDSGFGGAFLCILSPAQTL